MLKTELVNLFSTESDKEAVSLLLNWFKQLAIHGRIDPDDYQSLEYKYRSKEEVTMLVSALEEDRRKLFQSGLLEGKQQGRIEEKIENAKGMLANGMGLSLISDITKLTESQLVELRDELSSMKK